MGPGGVWKGFAGVRRRACLRLAALAAALAAGGAGAQDDDHGGGPDIDLDVTAFYDSNVTLAQLDDDIADDQGVEAAVTLSSVSGGLEGSAFGWSLGLKGVRHDEFEDLDRLEAEAGVKYIVQFRRGFSAPVFELSLTARAIDSESELRDGWQAEAGALATRRLTEKLVGRAGVRFIRRESEDFEAFDNERINVFVNGDLRTSQRSVLYGTYIFSTGDVVSTARPTLAIIDAAEVIEPDDAFGGLESNRFAYRLDAEVHIVTLGWNRALGPSSSIDASVQGLYADAEGDNDYERGLARLSYLHRF